MIRRPTGPAWGGPRAAGSPAGAPPSRRGREPCSRPATGPAAAPPGRAACAPVPSPDMSPPPPAPPARGLAAPAPTITGALPAEQGTRAPGGPTYVRGPGPTGRGRLDRAEVLPGTVFRPVRRPSARPTVGTRHGRPEEDTVDEVETWNVTIDIGEHDGRTRGRRPPAHPGHGAGLRRRLRPARPHGRGRPGDRRRDRGRPGAGRSRPPPAGRRDGGRRAGHRSAQPPGDVTPCP